MLQKKENKSSPFAKAILAFVVTYILLLSLFSFSFLEHFRIDLLEKNLNGSVLIEVLGLTLITYSVTIIPMCIFIFSLIYYRETIKSGMTIMNTKIKTAIFLVVGISIVCFLITSFVTPKIALRQIILLYEIRKKAPDKPLLRDANESLFVDSKMCSNLFELGKLSDQTVEEIKEQKDKAINIVLMLKDSTKINQILEDSTAKKIGITKADLLNKKTEKKEEDIVQNEALEEYVRYMLIPFLDKIEWSNRSILKNKIEQFKMIGLPFAIIFAYFIGIAIAIVTKRQNRLAPFLICFYLLVLPGIYYLKNLIEELVLN